MNINWQSYDDQFFQQFCNALLSLEVSKSFVPFSAPGRDGGIDGLFSGTYDGKVGEWRFQDKFHKTARKQAYEALKKDVLTEMRKLADEDHYIILSNVSLLPQERAALLSLGNQELHHLGKGNVFFDVWDDAKIHTLYIRHPILRLWVEDGFTTAQLISYSDYFDKELKVGIEDPQTLSNEFIGRKADLNLLIDYLTSDAENIAVVSGEAGIGKTRLVIEFFQNHLSKIDEWQALVLTTHRINFDRILFGLSGSVNTIVLVDDAHKFAPDDIADLRNLIRIPSQRKLKFILTGRRLLIDRALESIPTVEDKTIRQIPLSKLSPVETRELFQRQDNIGMYRDYIPQLVSTSNGRPILIVALLRAIHDNTPIPKIKDKDVLKTYVREYFNTFIRVVSEHTGTSRLRLEKLIRAICLLEPLPANDDLFYQQLAQFTEISLIDLRYFMDKLLHEGLAHKRYEFVLSPDYYSDIMLATGDEEFVISAIASFTVFISNIIVNLSAVDEAYGEEEKGRLGLAPILMRYIPQIEDAHPNKVQDILTTVSSITYQKPEFAKLAIELFVARLKKVESQELRDLISLDINNRSISRKSLYGSIARLLHDLLYHSGNEKFVFDVVYAIYECVPDLGLFKNTFGLDKRHIMHGYDFQQQEFFIAEAQRRLPNDHSRSSFFIEAFNDFLRLEFTVSSMDPFKKGQINLTTFYLSSDSVVVALRKKVIEALVSIYNIASSDDIKKRVVHELIDVPRGISASTRSKNPYVEVEEVLYILEFIKSIAGTMPLAANREVIDRLYWIKKWGADDRIIATIAELKKSLEPKSLPEKFLFLLNNVETRMDPDYPKQVRHIEEQAKILMDQYESDVIAESLAQVRRVQTNHLEFIGTVNKALFDGFPKKAMEVYDQLWRIDREYIHQYGSSFLVALRFQHEQMDFFWSKVSELEADGSPESLNVVLYIYFRLTTPLEVSDENLIDRLFSKHRDKWQLSFNLLMALSTLTQVGYDKSRFIASLFDTCPQRAADNFLNFNRDLEAVFLKELILHHTTRFNLSFEIQHMLSSLLEQQFVSEDELFDYLIRRFQVKNEQVAQNNYGTYDFVPHDNFNLLRSFDETGKLRVFFRALNWYVNSEFRGISDYYAKDLLEFLQPSKELKTEIAAHYQDEVNRATIPKQLQRIVASIDVFESKSMMLIDLVIMILKKGNEMSGIKLDELRASAYGAITSVGVKSGAVGQPFEVDIMLRQLIVDWIADHPTDDFANEFMRRIVQSIDQEIKRSTDRDDTLW